MDFRSFLMTAALLLAGTAHAGTVSLVPSATQLGVGETLTVDLVFSDLAPGQAVGGFDLDLTFDPGVLSLTGAAFGSALGADGVDQFTNLLASAGRIDIAAVSLLSEAELLVLQTGPFTLATLSFDTSQAGLAELRFDTLTPPGLLFSDAFGSLLASTVGAEPVITVGADGSSVPEPGSLALVALAVGAGLLPAQARRRQARPN